MPESDARRLTISAESYLDVIHELSHFCTPVRSVDVANRLNVSKVSVNKALRGLKQAGYVDQQPYGGIVLTRAGIDRAHAVAWRHAVISRFLQETLGLPDDAAEADACRIEHVISDQAVRALETFMETMPAGRRAPTPLPPPESSPNGED